MSPQEDALARRVAARLGARVRRELSLPEYARAAVLAPIVLRGGEPWLVFTRRPDTLRSHPGQVSFPGGRCDDSDGDGDDGAAATALREAEEELGLPRAAVRVLGLLDDVPTAGSRFVMTPVVGLVDAAPDSFRPNPDEVAEVFELPVARLADPSVVEELGTVERGGFVWRVRAYRVDERVIWGATARVLDDLLPLLA